MSDDNQADNIESLKNEMQKQQKELEWSKSRITKLEKELASSKSTLMTDQNELDEFRDRDSKLLNENADLKKQLIGLEEKIKLLVPDELKQELQENKELIAEKDKTIQDLQDHIAALMNETTETREKYEDEISQTAEKLIMLESSKEEIITKLKSEIDAKHGKRNEMEKLIAKKEAEKDELMIQFADLEGLQTEFLKEQKKIVGHFGDQDAKIKDLESILNKKENEITKLKSDISKIMPKAKEDKEKDKLITEFQTVLRTQEGKVQQLMMENDRYRNLDTEINNLRILNDEQKIKYREKAQSYESFILTLQSDLSDVRNQLIESEKLRIEQQSSIARLEALIGQVETQIGEKESFTRVPPVATSPSSAPGGSADAVVYFLNALVEKVKSNITVLQLVSAMAKTQEQIEKIFPGHSILHELSTLTRQLQEYPEGTEIDTQIQALLIATVEEWKNMLR